jgi:hypothetical protein
MSARRDAPKRGVVDETMRDQIPEEEVKSLFGVVLPDTVPPANLLPGALAGYRRKLVRNRIVGGVAAVAVLAVGVGVAGVAQGQGSGAVSAAKRPAVTTTSSSPAGTQWVPPTVGGTLPECELPWPVVPTDQQIAPGASGPRTPADATWLCSQSLPALRSAFGTEKVDVYKTSFHFWVPASEAGKPMPAEGYSAAGDLGVFQIAMKDGSPIGVLAVDMWPFRPKTGQPLPEYIHARCVASGYVCSTDGVYTVLEPTFWTGTGGPPKGFQFWVIAPNGSAVSFSLGAGAMSQTEPIAPLQPGASDSLPFSDAEMKSLIGNPNLVKLAEVELQRFAQ